MKNIQLTIITLLAILFQLNSFGMDRADSSDLSQNYLLLKKNNSEKIVLIDGGQDVMIWLSDGTIKIGQLENQKGDRIIISDKGYNEQEILVKDIIKIKTYKSPEIRFVGTVLTVVGGIILVYGGIALVVGVVALSAENIGAILLVAVPFLGLTGGLIYKLGRVMAGKKYNLQKKWSIEPI